jgi:hypothetical protein
VIGLRSGDVDDELIVDPRPSELLGERTIVLNSRALGLPAGTTVANISCL